MGEEQDLGRLVEASMVELQMKTEAHQGAWGFGKFDRWDMDTQQGDLIFTNGDGFTATCPAQAVGSYNGADGSWLWAWDNPSIPDGLKRDVLKVKAYGEEHGIATLTEPKLQLGDERKAWN